MTTSDFIALERPAATSDPEQQRRDLDVYGMCIVPDALTDTALAQLRDRLDEQASAERTRGLAYRDGGVDEPNQRVWNLVSKGEVFRDLVVAHLVRRTISHLLGSDFLLSSCTANVANPGGEPMRLHSDQGYVPPEMPFAVAANVLWMLDDFTEENGATRVVPGSHLSGSLPDPTNPPTTVPAEGAAGTAVVFDARIWHGTGTNRTNRARRGVFTYFCRPFIRPQENHTVSTPPEVLAAASPELRRLLGLSPWRSLGGRQGPYGVGQGPPLPSMTGKAAAGTSVDWFPEIDLDADIIGELS